VGLRGSSDQLATLAKRYRVSYSVQPAKDGHPYTVTHSSAVYVFNRAGEMKLLFTGLSQPNEKLSSTLTDLRAMVAGAGSSSWWHRVLSYL
jgi:protein SCO1/2